MPPWLPLPAYGQKQQARLVAGPHNIIYIEMILPWIYINTYKHRNGSLTRLVIDSTQKM